VKNIPALALALVCTTGILVSNSALAATATFSHAGATPFSSAGGTFALLGGAANPAQTDVLLNPNFTADPTDDKKAFSATFDAALNVTQDALSAVTSATKIDLKAAGGESTVLRIGTFGYTGTSSTATFSFDYSFIDDTKNLPLMNISVGLDRFDAQGALQQNLLDITQQLVQFTGTDITNTFSFDFAVNNGDQLLLSLYVSASSDLVAAPVPVPAALPLLGSALAGIAGLSKRRRNKVAQV
jgi:hypothetical protein